MVFNVGQMSASFDCPWLTGFAVNLLTIPVMFEISGKVIILVGLSLYRMLGIREV